MNLIFVVHFPILSRLERGFPYFIEVYLKEGTEEDYVLVRVCMCHYVYLEAPYRADLCTTEAQLILYYESVTFYQLV